MPWPNLAIRLWAFLDDLHWMDSASLELLKQIVREKAGGHGLICVGALRDSEEGTGRIFASITELLKSEAVIIEHIQLSGLSPENQSELLQDLLGEVDPTC